MYNFSAKKPPKSEKKSPSLQEDIYKANNGENISVIVPEINKELSKINEKKISQQKKINEN